MWWLLKQPVRRLANYLDDGPFLQKRWIPSLVMNLSRNDLPDSLLILADNEIRSKKDDPDWRLQRPWIILESSEDSDYKVFYTHNKTRNGRGLRSKNFISTQLFAMRLDDRDMHVLTIDQGGEVHTPSLYKPDGNAVRLKNYYEMKLFAYVYNRKTGLYITEI